MVFTTTTERPTIFACEVCLRTKPHDRCGYYGTPRWSEMSRTELRLAREDRIGSLALYINRYYANGWIWTWGDELPWHCTNGSGEGLFTRDSDGLHQIEGTSQYRLPRDERAARRKLHRDRLNSLQI